jgi:hypothetical protein
MSLQPRKSAEGIPRLHRQFPPSLSCISAICGDLRERPMREEKQRYHAFLLRLWPVKARGQTIWRASLESSHTGERWGFATLDALWAFLHQQTAVAPGSKAGERRCENEQICL